MSKVMSTPLVSLCLITYNQPDAIEKILQCLEPQVNSKIEILIKDDSPNNLTAEVVQKYSSRFNCDVRYFKGEKSQSGGYDKALLFVSQEARGQFLWWYGDDLMESGTVDAVIKEIENRPQMSFLWLNARDVNNVSDIGLDLGGDRVFATGSDVLQINIGLLGFPSITLIKKDEVLPFISQAQTFIGTTLTGFFLVLTILSQTNKDFVFLQHPYILSQPKPSGEKRWYDSFQVHGINYCKIALTFKDKFDSQAWRKGISDQFGRAWRAVLVERALGFKTGFGADTVKIKTMAQLYWTFPEFYLALPLMMLPRSVIVYFYQFYKWLRSIVLFGKHRWLN